MNMLLNAGPVDGAASDAGAVFNPSNPWFVIGCVAVIAIGVAIIAYIMFRTPNSAAKIGDVPSIELGDMPEAQETEETEEETPAEDAPVEDAEKAEEAAE